MPGRPDSINEAVRKAMTMAMEASDTRSGVRRSILGFGRSINEALANDLIAAGVDASSVRAESAAAESAGYRISALRWDLVIVTEGVPSVVIEWSSIGSPNNYNNRLDQIVGAATDLRISFEDADVAGYRPLVAALFIVDEPTSQGDRREYLDKFADSLRKMVSKGILGSACVLYFDIDSQNLADLSEDLGFTQFASSIVSAARNAGAGDSPGSARATDLGRLLADHGDVAGVVTGLTSTSTGLSAVEAAVIASRRNKIAELAALAAADGTTETEMHQAIGTNYWIFGSQYVRIAPRRGFVPLDQYDYALVHPDESIHIIELKGPGCSLVRKHRNHYIVSNDVHEAVSQCLNYLRALDELGMALETTYRNELGLNIDFRRARGTVIIGHSKSADTGSPEEFHLQQTIRSYNAHLSRIQVITYSDLLDTAARALRFEINDKL